MKTLLIATTALVATAGLAAADIANFRVSGTGRVGLAYDDSVGAGVNETIVVMRLRFNFDVAKELDNGVTVGGRVRLQYDEGRQQNVSGEGGAEINAAYVYAESGGIRVEVGNANSALDSMATLYNAEIGFTESTLASYAQASYAAYETSPYFVGEANRMGIFAQYAVGDLVARLSYITPDQVAENLPVGTEEEISFSLDYTVGSFSFGVGAAWNGGFVEDNDVYAVTAEYAINDSTNIGLHYVDNGSADHETVTLYGNTVLANGIGIQGYLGFNDDVGTEDVAFGLGFSYDLGGATLAGAVHKGFFDETFADIGVRFSW